MTKKQEQEALLKHLEQFKADYIEYQNKVVGQDLSDPVTISHIVSGIQRDVLSLYTCLIDIIKNK